MHCDEMLKRVRPFHLNAHLTAQTGARTICRNQIIGVQPVRIGAFNRQRDAIIIFDKFPRRHTARQGNHVIGLDMARQYGFKFRLRNIDQLVRHQIKHGLVLALIRQSAQISARKGRPEIDHAAARGGHAGRVNLVCRNAGGAANFDGFAVHRMGTRGLQNRFSPLDDMAGQPVLGQK